MVTMFSGRRVRFGALAVTLALGAAGVAYGQAADGAAAGARKIMPATPPPPSNDPKVPFEKYTLDNGLEVILIQDKKTPVVFVDVWYHVGSGDEVVGRSGFAHLFEHMMFQGTKNTGEDKHFDILRNAGASDVNGSTNFYRTNYYEQVPSNQLETALWLESERMGYLLPTLTKDSLKNQIDVVRNERRQRIDNVPYGKESMKLYEMLFPEGHPYRFQIIGRHEDLEAASVDDVKNFFKKWYAPANATLTLAGDFEIAPTKELIQKWFGGFPKTDKPAHRTVAAPKVVKQRVTIEDPFAKLRRVHYAWLTPTRFAPGDAELDLLSTALGDSGTGRLYKKLVIERQLARSVEVVQGSEALASVFEIQVDLNPDADMAEVEKIIDAELDRVVKEGISDAELKRAVVNYEAAFVWGLESLRARAETLHRYNQTAGDPDYITQDLNRYRTSSPARVQEAARTYLSKDARVEIITLPKGGK
jgi:zinc protease